jgi:(R,R)-butanediol dehydrogenase/meso-butanediol dehydrogenase/diacetyl reductase
MTAEMLALRWHARGDIRLERVPVPPRPARGEVQLRVLWCGICGTDIEEWRHGPVFIPAGEPHPLSGAVAPITLGHEVTGQITAIGPDVSLPTGQVVAVDGLSSCGVCRWCARGRLVLCEQLAAVGLMADGGLAEFCNVPARGCVPLPATLRPDHAALAETLAVGVRALARARFVPGETVGIFGAGAVGLLAMQAALAGGAAGAWVIDPREQRTALASKLGAAPVSATWGPAFAADVVLECSGQARAAADAVEATRSGGRAVLVGIYSEPVSFNAISVVTGEKELLGSLSHVYATDFATAVRLLADGTVVAEPLVSRRAELRSAIKVFTDLAEHPGEAIKVLIRPGDDPP